LINILILRLCNYDKSPDHVESAGKFTLSNSNKTETEEASREAEGGIGGKRRRKSEIPSRF
jgi:hypothetical protein